MGCVQFRDIQNCTGCKETAQESNGEIKAVVVEYATTLTENITETDLVHREKALYIDLAEDEIDLFFQTRKNDIPKIETQDIRKQAQAIGDAFKKKGKNTQNIVLLDSGPLEKSLLRQIEKKNFDE